VGLFHERQLLVAYNYHDDHFAEASDDNGHRSRGKAMRYALAALLVLVTVGASGQEPKPSLEISDAPTGYGYMRACGHQKWCFSFNGGPEISSDELADRAKMLERIEKLEKRVDELEAWHRAMESNKNIFGPLNYVVPVEPKAKP